MESDTPSGTRWENWSESTLRMGLIFVVVVYFFNFGALGFLIGPFDVDHLSGYYELAWHYWKSGQGLFPAFNPFLCGGRTLGADPQIPIFHPLVIFVPLLGATWTLKLEMLGQLIGGVYGLLGIFHRFGLQRFQMLWGVFVYLSGGAIVARYMVGHVTLGFYALAPLFLYLSYSLSDLPRGQRGRLRLLNWALYFYCSLYKPNFLIYAVPLLLLEQTVRAILLRRPQILIEGVLAVVIATLAAAVTYLPAGIFFSAYPRRDGSGPQLIAFYAFFANLLMPLKAIPKAWYGPGFLQRHEYNLFLGPAAVFFAILGIRNFPRPFRAEKIALLVLAVVAVWVGIGSTSEEFSPFFPYTWLREFWPGFRSIRVPTRFWFYCSFALVIFSAVGVYRPKTAVGFFGWLLLGFLPLLANAGVNVSKTSLESTHTQWVGERRFPQRIFFEAADDHFSYERLKRGTGALDCVDNIEAFRSPEVVPGDALYTRTSAPAKVDISWADWSTIPIVAQGLAPYSIILNINHSPYWTLEGTNGKIVSKAGQNLSLVIDDQSFRGTLRYQQPWVKEALLISTLTILVVCLYTAWVLMTTKPPKPQAKEI